MLTALHIQNFVLIEQARLEVGRGLTALTGETGAGKSILLDALGLAVGGRAERGVLRRGATQGVVTATFEIDSNHPVWTTLAENALPVEDDAVILRRVQTPDGKSRAFVNDHPVGVALLRLVGEQLLEIHGQHDGRGFLTASTHRATLDEFAGLAADIAGLSEAFRRMQDSRRALEERCEGRRKAANDADYFRHVVGELEALGAAPGEEAALAARRAELVSAERVGAELAQAERLLGEEGLCGKLSASARRLQRAAAGLSGATLDMAAVSIAAAVDAADAAREALDAARRRFAFDADEQARVEERLFALRAAARKHGVSVDALPEALAQTSAALAALEADELGLGALEADAAAAEADYAMRARKASEARRKAAVALDAAVARELAPLKLGRALFTTEIRTNPDRPGAEGIDQVEFMIATNPGAPSGPLKTIASGGELSRFVLAMKAALAAKEHRTVIIFDEVDAGVGGAVADAVGERLARLARDAQVLVVTHSPQVAARADSHWRVEKRQGRSETTTEVEALSADQRIEEIARMLSGAVVTDEARAAARRLLGAAPVAARPRKKSA